MEIHLFLSNISIIYSIFRHLLKVLANMSKNRYMLIIKLLQMCKLSFEPPLTTYVHSVPKVYSHPIFFLNLQLIKFLNGL